MPVIGTRREAIKLAPVIKELEKHPKEFEVVPVVAAQYGEIDRSITDLNERRGIYAISKR